ncbi:MAG: glycogen synthase GlgA [Verrucomicrobiia bacterium]|jgi:starch synthase
MKILFAASEMTPYAKTGGLGDVVGALAGELSRRGHEVTCCVPFYRCARESAGRAKRIGVRLRIPLGSFTVSGEVVELKQRDGVRVWFVRCDEFFDRAELYYDGVRDYADNAERFLFFSKAVVELMGAGGAGAEVVHCHDWQTAFVPVAMRQGAARGGAGFGVKTVLTIHNLAYQGIFPAEDFALTNLGGEMFAPAAALEFYGWMNLLKGGIVFADTITTVSRRYAEEMLTAAEGCGLEPVLATRAEDLHGIVNGVDYGRWNPATDRHLRQRYGVEELAGKGVCREDLVRRVGLVNRLDSARISETQLVAGFVSRLTEQKGVEVLAGAMEGLVGLGVRVVVLGRGERKYEEVLTNVAARFPGRVVVKIGHDEPLAHQIQGGADLLLMPSRFEPCGLTQLYALKYGTIPVVHATGGLDDTIRQYNPRSGAGTGFKFASYTSAALVAAVHQAILLHKQPKKWQKLMRHAMACDFSWQASAKEYETLYAAP